MCADQERQQAIATDSVQPVPQDQCQTGRDQQYHRTTDEARTELYTHVQCIYTCTCMYISHMHNTIYMCMYMYM